MDAQSSSSSSNSSTNSSTDGPASLDQARSGGVLHMLRLLFSGDHLGWDVRLLLVGRFLRLFAFAWLALALVRFLLAIGVTGSGEGATTAVYTAFSIGQLLAAALLSDLVISTLLATASDVLGRRHTLLLAAGLQCACALGVAFWSERPSVLIVCALLGGIRPTGGESGPFLAVEQSALSETLAGVMRADAQAAVIGAYQCLGYIGQAAGALLAGLTLMGLQTQHSWTEFEAARFVVVLYAFFSAISAILYFFLSSAVEPLHPRELATPRDWVSKFVLHRPESTSVVAHLCILTMLDAFAGGLILQSFVAYYFSVAWSMAPEQLGFMLFLANLFAGVSALTGAPLVARIGALPTLLWTHVPSNILLICVPFASSSATAIVLLLARFCASQNDVPARATYVALVLQADERAAAGQWMSFARGLGLSAAPLLAGYLFSDPARPFWLGMPFVLAGGLKCAYDALLYLSFKAAPPPPPEEVHYAQVGVSIADVRREAPQDISLYDEDFEAH